MTENEIIFRLGQLDQRLVLAHMAGNTALIDRLRREAETLEHELAEIEDACSPLI